MPLDIISLRTAVKDAFQKAKDTPAPTDPDQSGDVQDEIIDRLSRDLATAIDAYVRSGDVNGVTVEVKDIANNNVIGTGTQTAGVKIE